MTKLVIQIPCYNEEETLLTTLNDLPKSVDGIDEIEILVINDGSTDKSSQIAEEWGASVLEIKPNKGLANAFRSGLQEALKRGADIIVNTDADNQYCAEGIKNLVKPVLSGEADIVIGARNILEIKEFSPLKKCLQKLGSAVLRLLSSTPVEDAPSGFRAFSREAALKLNVFDNYTYTMETLIQAGAKGLKIKSVPCEVNPKLRNSRLFKNIFEYVFRSMKTTIRMFIVYRPFRFFISLAAILAIAGFGVTGRFLYYYLNGAGNGHIQSLILAAILLLTAVQLGIVAIIGDLMSINRKLLEDIQTRIKKLELR
ncbi:MAG: glycosyltransferase family 2 protein [Candidatus Gastranaerophilales bacterium]|nr:glycosyltransferase family 2 protein [Candidatus Gastranaerophilales bacterium]MCM1072812.1 glycosyltransferase family 2 protein [Bacteroides sp.]